MTQHIVKVVEDGALGTDEGWAMAHSDDLIAFVVERSAAMNGRVLTDAWAAALQFEDNAAMERAVRDGIDADAEGVAGAERDDEAEDEDED